MRTASLTALAAATILSFSSLSGAAAAADLPRDGLTRQEVADWLKRDGYSANIHPNDNGLMIVSSTIEGVNYDIYFYSCLDNGRCRSLQYAAGWTGATGYEARAAKWNSEFRYLRTYVSGDNLWVEYDLDIGPGGSWELLAQSRTTFVDMLREFRREFGLN